jgi:hypothetical protein
LDTSALPGVGGGLPLPQTSVSFRLSFELTFALCSDINFLGFSRWTLGIGPPLEELADPKGGTTL